jgi:hypothetical protein
MGPGPLVRTALTTVLLALGGPLQPETPAAASSASPAAETPTPIEGYGALTRGGADHPECLVESLEDAGPGTLRGCLTSGNRHVRFAVGGTIALASQLTIQGSFVTIDGLGAPPPGITLRGWGLDIRDVHDVIVRGLRIRDAGPPPSSSSGKSSTDCIGVKGPGAFNIVIDRISIHNCADGGIDISSGPKDITIQWSIVSTRKAMLWGSTSSSPQRDTDRISLHHSMLICGAERIGCDRLPLVRANGYPLRADIRHNVFEGGLRANATKIEPAAEVNVVGNAYIPRPASTLAQRQDSIAVNPGTRVYTAGNVELGASPRPELDSNGNEAHPFSAPPITERALGCVVRGAGMHPRDAVDRQLLRSVTSVPEDCAAPEAGPPGGCEGDPCPDSREEVRQ